MQSQSVLGKDTILERCRSAFKRMGIESYKTKRAHAMRSKFITDLANDDGVSIVETMAAARNKSASASAAYQTTSKKSEVNRLKALLSKKRKTSDEEVEKHHPAKRQNQEIVEFEPEDEPPKESDTQYSVFTQLQVDALNNDMERLTTLRDQHDETRSESNSSSSGNWLWDLPQHHPAPASISPPPTRNFLNDARVQPRRNSYSQPRRDQYSPNYGRHLATRRESEIQPRRNPYHRNYSRRVPSRRENDFLALRERVRQLEHEERMRSFPYRNDQEESNELYFDSLRDASRRSY